MNKKEAAAFLSCSQKTIDRLIKGGELPATLQKGKTRDVVVLDDDALARYKEQREQPKLHMPSLMKADHSESSRFDQSESFRYDPPAAAQSLIVQTQTKLNKSGQAPEIGSIEHLAEAMRSQAEANQSLAEVQKTAVLQNKPMLNLHEAALVSGLSITSLEKAVRAGTLKTFAGARGSKVIRRKDLDQFIDELKSE
jgi:hypothetical protein